VRARDVVGWGRLSGWSFLDPFHRRRDREATDRALHDVEATPFATRTYGELSFGQRQRVLFARMLAAEPELAILDEPTAAMDAVAERDAFDRLTRLTRERDMAVVVVTHYLELARRHADTVLFMDRDDGQIVLGEPDTVFGHPAFIRRYGPVAPAVEERHGG
jgi:zinc transport system ATP-binding protein